MRGLQACMVKALSPEKSRNGGERGERDEREIYSCLSRKKKKKRPGLKFPDKPDTDLGLFHLCVLFS